MSEKIKNWLLYAGFKKEEYQSVLPMINDTNRILTVSVSAFATILISIMALSASRLEGVKPNQIIYIVGALISLTLFLASLFLAKKHKALISPLMIASYSIFYIYGILIGTITSPHEKTVTFIVMLVYLPTLFIDRPLHILTTTILYNTIFIGLCFQTKTGGVLDNDVIDAVVFGILGIASGTIINHMIIKGYISEYKLAEANEKLRLINRTDSMTGMQNRAAYDKDITKLSSISKECLACIYIDADGLKIINDTFGHKSGDIMLKFVAEKIVDHFGSDLTYRTGGDEFVAFVPDPGDFEIKTRTDRMIKEIEDRGYHVSVGWKIHDLNVLSMPDLEKEAENFMYDKKEQFHNEHPEFNRKDRKD